MGTTLVLTKILCFLLTTMLIGSAMIQCSITYDNKAIVINGHRRILLSGSIHYPRSTPEMWEDLIKKAKDGGLDVIDTYVFWNGHEPSPGTYNFRGRYDLVRFIKTVQDVGLYVHLRIGPYVCAEWNFGGFPVWLKYVPGISFRSDNGPFKAAMQGFTQKIVQMMKDHRFFASQGGPIILSQIENEFGPELKALGPAGHSYVNWAAKMAVGLKTGVPWVMCKEDDAPDPIINACNGFYCDYFTPNKPYKPKMWTEAWSGWFTEFGGTIPKRPVEDLAFGVTRFIQKGGSYINYYMYHGGTNFGRTAGGPFITTSYDYDAPIDEYGLVQEPKYSHLKQLHQAIKQCESALVSSEPKVTKLGNYEEAHVFSAGKGSCVAFLSNYHMNAPAKVVFNKRHYTLPAWSTSILPDCRNVVFNTATVVAKTSHVQMVPSGSILYSVGRYDEDIASYGDRGTITALGLLEQINVTRDTSDYLWYITSAPVNLRGGANRIALLSVAVGLPNVGAHFETWATGIVGSVALHGLDGGNKDLSRQKWTYQVGLRGEAMNLISPTEASSVDWMKGSLAKQNKQPLTWYKAFFDAPRGNEPLALDLRSMGKGQAWINGESLGRYWMAFAKGNCGSCNYAGTYREAKCQSGCGEPTQRWYHVPRSWLKPRGNLLVLFEELGGDVSKVSVVKRSVH
ncbi:unnamed protein product [Eruca vesicaria subsp. sativa]|uniref:Beta-galactosidase n=1 Tax=Eruca vesicaria subsp. sativa TaxID=29727 RepID=A0ABC8JZX2_ERUVS|nr:unnamed protein product [Eruca vesicaria subsp. sativa]